MWSVGARAPCSIAGVNVGVLASGQGTNLEALLETVHGDEITIAAVASDKADARALRLAAEAGVETAVFPRAEYRSREQRDAAMADWLHERGVELVVLAGYMSILSPGFLRRFDERVINVHPSLLPAFPGLNAVRQAIDYGTRIFGVTVHFVDDGVDSGPIILQSAVEIDEAHDEAEVHSALRPTEHRLLPHAVRLIARRQIHRDPDNPRRMHIAAEARD